MNDRQRLREKLLSLTAAERLALARWLLDSVLEGTGTPPRPPTAERAEELLDEGVGQDDAPSGGDDSTPDRH